MEMDNVDRHSLADLDLLLLQTLDLFNNLSLKEQNAWFVIVWIFFLQKEMYVSYKSCVFWYLIENAFDWHLISWNCFDSVK